MRKDCGWRRAFLFFPLRHPNTGRWVLDLNDEFSGDVVTFETIKKRRQSNSVYDHNVIVMVLFLIILMVLMLVSST